MVFWLKQGVGEVVQGPRSRDSPLSSCQPLIYPQIAWKVVYGKHATSSVNLPRTVIGSRAAGTFLHYCADMRIMRCCIFSASPRKAPCMAGVPGGLFSVRRPHVFILTGAAARYNREYVASRCLNRTLCRILVPCRLHHPSLWYTYDSRNENCTLEVRAHLTKTSRHLLL